MRNPLVHAIGGVISVDAALELGDTELMHGKSGEGESLWAGLTDKLGAALGITPLVDGPSLATDHTGRISWLSLNVQNASASQNFYQRVIGWNVRPYLSLNLRGGEQYFQMQIDDGSITAKIFQATDSELGSLADPPACWRSL